jgi:TonB-linked SusC/RagA family outer membrane protein
MNDMLQGKRWFGTGHLHFLSAVGMSVLLAVALCGTAPGQEPAAPIEVSGKVTTTEGHPISGVSVRVRGSSTSTSTDAQGSFTVQAPPDGVLTFNLIGFRGTAQGIAGRTTINVAMDRAIAVLPEVVVTGYTAQRRADITGAVGTVDVESIEKQTSTSVLQRLDGRVPGVSVDASGSPGSRTTVRVRGITSFQNNDPLYIIDGTPIAGDSYLNWLNPDDIAEVQVLKDAAAASIYGSRASNGVIMIETKKGKPGQRHMTLDVRTSVATPAHGYDDFLMQDALQYYEVVKRGYLNAGDTIPDAVKAIYGVNGAGTVNPTVAPFIYPNDGKHQTTDTLNLGTYAYPGPGNNGATLIMPGSAGTNWWKAVFSPASVADANLRISGGGVDNAYNVSFNFLNQNGTAAYNRLQRGTVRVNTAFNLDRFVVGENIALSREQHFGGIPNDDGGEDGILGKNILMQPVVPVYDIGGHFASGKAVSLGNNSNPLGYAWQRQFDRNTNDQLMGNVYAGLDVTKRLSAKTRLGFNLGQQAFRGYNPITPENSEPGTSNSIDENQRQTTDWTWTNTLSYLGTFGRHTLNVLAGQEANKNTTRFLAGHIGNLLNTDPSSRYIRDALADPATKNDSSVGSVATLLSFFGKADYSYAERYYLSATLRRDGSSTFGASHRWGTFPAFSVGWRLSQEPFFGSDGFFSNVMLRFGWGKTGNQNIPQGRIVSQYGGGRGDTFYDIGNTGTVVRQGFRQTALGNPDLKWEENKSVNVGLDLAAFQGRGNLSVDVYERKTNNLLFDPRIPATAGKADPAIVNIGAMRNRGIDFNLGYRGTLGEKTSWSVNFNGSHYNNKIISIDNVAPFFFGPNPTRLTNHVINQVGDPIGAFYGYQADGYFNSAAEIAALDAAAQAATGDPTAKYQDGEAPGRLKFRDVNGDGRVTGSDFTIIGSPHPDFTAGLDFSLRRGAWDLSFAVFGTFGNQIFDDQKDFYVFRDFSTNVRNDLLTNSWCAAGDPGCTTPGDPNAKYPRIDNNDVFSRQVNSFYVEDGSYVRLRSLQIGYTLPPAMVSWIPGARIYVQAENLFTFTGYSGLDPSLPAQNFTGPAGDIRDQYRGVDRGSYPTSRTFTVGISTTF